MLIRNIAKYPELELWQRMHMEDNLEQGGIDYDNIPCVIICATILHSVKYVALQ